MIEYWDSVCKKEGFAGIYIVETLNFIQYEPCLHHSEAVVYFEPNFTLRHDLKKHDLISKCKRWYKTHISSEKYQYWDIEKLYYAIENRKHNFSKTIYGGTFNDWDNTPRRGNRSIIMKGANPCRFEKNLRTLMKDEEIGDYIFVNAWNEWAEGAYLEPDVKNGYSFLQSIKNLMI